MGVAADLGYAHRHANAPQRVMQRFGATKAGAWFFSKTLVAMDRAVIKMTKGRTTVPELLAGLPVMFVTTTGRKSGLLRTTPLVAIPIGDTLALIGSNFGTAPTPAWVHNLEADPTATVRYRNAELEARVRPATDEEYQSVWGSAASVTAAYGKYRERVTNRDIRIFVMTPAPTST